VKKYYLFYAVCSFIRLFTSSDKPSKKPSTSPALSYKGSTKQGTVRPVGDPNRSSRERADGQTSRAFDFLQDDLYVDCCDLWLFAWYVLWLVLAESLSSVILVLIYVGTD